MRIHEVMSTGVVTGAPTDTVRDVVVKLLSRHCGAIPIVNANQELLGIVTLRDVMRRCTPTMAITFTTPTQPRLSGIGAELSRGTGGKAEEIMVRNPLTGSPETPILEAASYMGLKNFRRLPVADHGTLVGMVSIGDIHRGLLFSRGGCEVDA